MCCRPVSHPAAARVPLNSRVALLVAVFFVLVSPVQAITLWNDLGATLAHNTGDGRDLLGGAVKRDDTASDTLYFKFHVDPLSDVSTEEYFAGFELFEGPTRRLAIGNANKAWAYSAFHTAEQGESNKYLGDFDLRSARPESSAVGVFKSYELPRRGNERTIVFKVEYVPGNDDRVTVWLNPDLGPGATEGGQPEGLITRFRANCTFSEIHVRHGGGGDGWTFSDMAIATSFSDFAASSAHDSGKAPSAAAGRDSLPFSFRAWQQEQGLPHSAVRALAQTREGYLWIGSDAGVTRFDGVRFVAFGEREGLRSGAVTRIAAGAEGALWIGSANAGLTEWHNGQSVSFTTSNGLPANTITALASDANGRLWVGTSAGLGAIKDGRCESIPAEALQGKAITALFPDRRGTLWLTVKDAGVFHFQNGRLTPLTDDSTDRLLRDSHCVLVDQQDRLWVGAGDDFVLCRDGAQWRRYRIPRHLEKPHINTLAESPDGSVWAGSVSEGLFHFKDGKLTAINASSGMLDNFVGALLVDQEGNLWAGTSAGLTQLRPKQVACFGREEGLGYGPAQGLAEVAPGLIWAGKANDGLYRWQGRNFTRVALAGLPRNDAPVNAVLATRAGACWVATGKGLFHIANPKSDTPEPQPATPIVLNVISLAEDRQGTVWAGTREGEVWRLQGDQRTVQTDFSQTRPITTILPGSDGSLWIGTDGDGLHRYLDQRHLRYGKANGLLSDSIRALLQDAQGALWIGTVGGGLARWQEGRLAVFTSREGLPDDTVSQILEDENGQLWLGGNRGIAAVRKADLAKLAAGESSALYPRIFGRAEGMLSEECTGGYSPSGLKTRAGLLWFSTLKGLVVINPQLTGATQRGPSVVLEEVLVDGAPIASEPVHQSENSVLRIPPGRHRVEVRYTALGFAAPERIRFRHRMEGLESDWVEAGTRRAAFYSYVPPGKHRFQVLACSGDGVWNETGASLTLNVLPYFWQTSWFLAAVAIGLFASVVGSVRFIEKRKAHRQLRQLERERTLERERARIAQDLHDDLGASLSRISLLSDMAMAETRSHAPNGGHVDKISQLAGQTLRALDEIVWAVRPGSDSLQSLVEYIAHYAGELFKGNGVRCRLDLPDTLPARSLPPDMRHNIFLIAKEALTNSMKHAAAREVSVQIQATAGHLEILIRDDGHGFDLTASPGVRDGNGLMNMRQRAQAIGGTLDLQTQQGKGTSVRLCVALAGNGRLSDLKE